MPQHQPPPGPDETVAGYFARLGLSPSDSQIAFIVALIATYRYGERTPPEEAIAELTTGVGILLGIYDADGKPHVKKV